MNVLLLEPKASCAATRWPWPAVVGALLWLPAVPLLELGWGAAMLLLAVLVLVPLALGLVREVEPETDVLDWLHLPAAMLLSAAYAFPPGWLPALLAVPWLLFTAAVGWWGLQRFWRYGIRRPDHAGLTAALLYLPVGGAWAVLSRLGARPLEFSDVIVQATAVHFHYAGFVLPIVAGLQARHFHNTWTTLTVWGAILGVPLVAVGITLSALGVKQVELPAAWLMALAGLSVAVLQIRLARGACWVGALLFAASGLSLLFGMVLAAIYALGVATGGNWLDNSQMLAYHGAVNALGFALPALLAWNRLLTLAAIDDGGENHHSK
ncbi:MAG: YndJ family transporter [Planctomycetia bacterium]|nr:YndJ family transporter [Planctomycetia bacterium]